MQEKDEQNSEGMSAANAILSAHKEKKEQEKDATKHLVTTAGKGAASYFGGPLGGDAVDEVAKTKQGDKVLDKVSSKLNKIPGVGKTAKKLEDKGITDAADKVINVANMAGLSGQQGSGLDDFFSKVNQRKAGQNQVGTNNSGIPQEQESGNSSHGNLLHPFSKKRNEKASDFEKNSSLDEENSENSTGMKVIGKLGKGLGKFAGILSLPLTPVVAIIALVAGILGIFFVTTTSTITVVGSYSVDYLISEKWGESLNGIEVDDSMYEPEQVSFVNRIIDIATEYRNNNKYFNPHLISAAQFVIAQNNKKFTYNQMTNSVMREYADLMFDENGIYDEDLFRENMIQSFLPRYAPSLDPGLYDSLVDEIFEYISNYEDLALVEGNYANPGGTVCTYVAPGTYSSSGARVSHPINATDIQVELLETGIGYGGMDYGGTDGKPMEGVDLVPFEEYSSGVQQEIDANSSKNTLSAQIIASRSYALARAIENSRLFQRNNQWILQTAASTNDQVYCSSRLGCSSNKTTDKGDACQWGMIYPGTTGHGTVCQGPLPDGHILFQLEKEMAGKVLVDSDGYIIWTGYNGDIQDVWAASGTTQDYTQILLATYADKGAVEVKQMVCTASSADGDYRNWKQYDPEWGSIPLSPSQSTMSSIGCLVTSIATLIAKSGVPTNVEGSFNPGTFVKAMSKVDAFASSGNLVSFAKATQIAPQFKYQGEEYLTGKTESEKVAEIQNLLNQGYYLIAQVSNDATAQHYVAIDTVEGNQVKILDPGFDVTNLFATYDTNRIIMYQKGN